jgi:UDP-N-acetylmuramate--alanine ligase
MTEHIHFIGIGGAGLSAIATVLLQQGYTVSGSDQQASPATARLTRLGATVFTGHHPENLDETVDGVVISSAIPADNPERIAARQRGLPVMKRADWLGQMMEGQVGIAIAGTHGKTTTSALTAFMLKEAGHQPTYIVGGFVPQLDSNAEAGAGQAFVIEADEYDYMFLGLKPKIAVLTTVEWDHPDIFSTPEMLHAAFERFVQQVPADGLIIVCGDDPGVRTVIAQAKAPVITYGLQETNHWQAVDLQPNRQGGYDFKLKYHPDNQAEWQSSDASTITPPGSSTFSLTLPGLHNVYNALAVLIIANYQGLDRSQVAESLSRFTGVGRRFELKGETNGITVIDDYAHHPTEIKATLAAARSRFGACPIWAVFQPHTFSRTRALLDQFAGAFEEADQVVIVDIFPSREIDEGLVNSQDIVDRMEQANARYIGSRRDAADYLATYLSPPAVLITLGAGDGYQIGEWVLERLAKRVEG